MLLQYEDCVLTLSLEKYNITKKIAISNVGFLDPLLSHVFGFSVPLAWIPLMKLPFSGKDLDVKTYQIRSYDIFPKNDKHGSL
jgi:hypothetical protein